VTDQHQQRELPADLLTAVLAGARRHGGRTAVTAPDGSATYAQLAARAAAMAQAFRDRGVGPGDRVALVMAAGRDSVAAALAAFMIGAAYVPIDPAQPAQRLRQLLAGCRPAVCLAAPEAVAGLDEATAPDQLGGAWPPADRPAAASYGCRGPLPTDVAYIIHTSGSTGVPKGVRVGHRGVLNLIADMDARAPVPDPHRGAVWTSPDFDVSVWETWSPLCTGGTAVMVPARDRLEAGRYLDFLHREGVHSAYVPPAFLPDLRTALEADPHFCGALTRLLVGVEPIALGLLQALMRARPGLGVVNGYGPAETTVACSLFTVPVTGGDPLARTPIGTAVKGGTLLVVDDTGAPSPSGEGELVVLGEGVAHGYLNARAASRDAFAPWPGRPDSRAYRTGDLVRTLPDGNLVFVGRADRQLKVRGYRIEPGEVETAVRAVAPVQDVVVGARDLPGRGPAVVAYVRVKRGEHWDADTVRGRLRDRLPVHALPAEFVRVESLPQTKNGKTDHEALAALPLPETPKEPSRTSPTAHAEPDDGTPLAAVLRSWRTALDRPHVGADQGFVALGGTSLGAVRAAALLRADTGRDVQAADVLVSESAAALAALMGRRPVVRRTAGADRGAREAGAGAALPSSPPRSVPLNAAQLAVWLHEKVSADHTLYLENACYELIGELDEARLTAALEETFAACPAFGAALDTATGQPALLLGRHEILVEHRTLETAPTEAELDAMVRRESLTGVSSQSGPLARCLLITVDPRRRVLLLVWHHLVIDGVSLRLVLAELRRRYDDGTRSATPLGPVTPLDPAILLDPAASEAAPLPAPLSASEAHDRAAAVARRLKGTDLLPLKAHGAGVAAPAPPEADQGRSIPVEPIRHHGTPLAELASRAGATLPAMVLTAFQRAVGEALGRADFPLGLVTAGRASPEALRAIGCFVNTVLMRGSDDRGTPPEPALRESARRLAEALTDQEVPFSMVAAELLRGVRPRPRHFPQVYLSMDVASDLALPGTTCTRRRILHERAKFDVALILEYQRNEVRGELQFRTRSLNATAARALVEGFTAQLSTLASQLDQ
jgi:mycobactin peptide synthetase MbtE